MKSGPPSERLVKTISVICLLALIGYILADLTILSFREKWLPSQAPPPKIAAPRLITQTDRSRYDVITNKNIFRADQTDPNPLGSTGEEGKPAPDADPVPSSLPLQLVGTIVHGNPARSVATILVRNKNEQIPVKVEGDLDGMAVITKIERAKVIFRNNATRALEYIEMKDDSKISFGAPVAKQNGEVMQKSETEFELKRDDVNKLTQNLPALLQDARAVPRMGPNGTIECFSLADIREGSIYTKLGLKRGDCIKSVNGEKIDSPGKAMDMYNALRSGSSQIQIGIDRGGRDENMNYSIQ